MAEQSSRPVESGADVKGVPVASRLQTVLAKLGRVKAAVVAVAGVGAVLSGLLGFWTVYKAVKTDPPAPKMAAAAPGISMVVMPFSNLSTDPDQAYFADALTTTLTAGLSRITGAFVIAPTTAMTYKGKPVGVQQVGVDLGVRFVLQGSVQRSGQKIRVNAQMADSRNSQQLWNDSFEGDASDVFALQDQITARIANAIGREVLVAAARESESRKSKPEAVDLLMQGIALNYRPPSLKTLQEQEATLRKALAADPSNVWAMTYLARGLVLQGYPFRAGLPAAEADAKLKEGYELALATKGLDPGNARAYQSIALYLLARRDFTAAIVAAETSVELDKNNPVAYITLSAALTQVGEQVKSIEVAKQAILLDPRGPTVSVAMTNIGKSYLFDGKPDEAIEWLRKAVTMNPTLWTVQADLAVAYTVKGDAANASATVAEMRRTMPPGATTLQRPGFPTAGSPEKFKKQVEDNYLPAARKVGLPL